MFLSPPYKSYNKHGISHTNHQLQQAPFWGLYNALLYIPPSHYGLLICKQMRKAVKKKTDPKRGQLRKTVYSRPMDFNRVRTKRQL